LEVYDSLPSTNTWLLEKDWEETPHGFVVATEYQTAGKGRQGRHWIVPPYTSLLFSVVLKSQGGKKQGGETPPLRTGEVSSPLRMNRQSDVGAVREPPLPPSLITLAGACAVVHTLHEWGVKASLKWPNDVIDPTNGKKLGGVLCEAQTRGNSHRWILGIGLNVNLLPEELPDSLSPIVSSVQMMLGQPVDRNRLLAGILQTFDSFWNQLTTDQGQDLLVLARSMCDTLGHQVHIERGPPPSAISRQAQPTENLNRSIIKGIAEDLDSRGCLVVRAESGVLQVVEMGEIIPSRRMD
jgi:BirA family biotin operon repressor/biotin-[acetyl-CoA-carboxylase] ligase